MRLSGEIECLPLNKVAKRLAVGPERNLAQFVAAAVAGPWGTGAARQLCPPQLSRRPSNRRGRMRTTA